MLERISNARREHGQVMVMFALMLPVLVGMMGLGIDAAKIFQARRDLQGQNRRISGHFTRGAGNTFTKIEPR